VYYAEELKKILKLFVPEFVLFDENVAAS